MFAEKMNRLARWMAFLGVMLLAACAAPQNPRAQLDAWIKANPDASRQRTLIIDVPATDNAIAGAMVVASLRSGVRSNAVDSIVQVLEQPPAGILLVTSRDAEIASATLEAALRAVAGKAAAGHRVVLLGSNPVPRSLADAADAARVSVEPVPAPGR